MIFEFTDSDASPMSRAVLVGVHIAALCVLKTSLIPAALAFAGVQSCFAVMRASIENAFRLDLLVMVRVRRYGNSAMDAGRSSLDGYVCA